ncbi:hypothetical protein V494_03124 [Pseudogymnoascus sp. VKM F-4513 (FW-928)]|nr:hypothetical protein V494_03124 [Pseudogymnoascus sp. VKM F-4513 (FW-928)]
MPPGDWRTSPPPPELLYPLSETSDHIKATLGDSIRFIQAVFAREEQLAKEEQQHQLDQLAIDMERLAQSERQPAPTESNLRQQEPDAENHLVEQHQSVAESLEHPLEQSATESSEHSIETPPGHDDVSAPVKKSKGKERAVEEPQETPSNMDSPASAGCPPSDIETSLSSRRRGQRNLRSYITTIFKPGSRSNRGLFSKRTPRPTLITEECVCCMENFCDAAMVHLQCHGYCIPCFTLLIKNSMTTETAWPPKCCLNEIPEPIILSNIVGKLKVQFQAMAEERSIPIEDRVYCSKPACGSWIPLHKMDKALFLARCPQCRHKTCMTCRGSYHSDGECPEDPSLKETLRCAINAGWRRCYKCNALVEHDQGCSHMICRCKAQFCYTCGLRWKTCGCKEIELEAHLIASQWRTENAASRAQADVAGANQAVFSNDLQEVLDQLENSEGRSPAETTLKEKALAVAVQREANENRDQNFWRTLQELREEMDNVHSLQHIQNFMRFETQTQAAVDFAKRCLVRADKTFNEQCEKEKERERARQVRRFQQNGLEPTKELLDEAVEAVWMESTSDRAKMQVVLDDRIQMVNARMEAQLEELRLKHQWDYTWFEQAERVRGAMVMQLALDAHVR